jgi:hypothetical protein
MSYIKLETLNEVLKDVPKDIIIRILHEHVKFKPNVDIQLTIIDVKKTKNLEQQREILREQNSHKRYTGNNKLEWLKNHEEWDRLNTIFNKLSNEYDALSEQREKLVRGERNE